VRVELLDTPDDYVGAVLERSKKKYVQRQYKIKDWDSPEDFLEKLCKRTGKLGKGGEPDLKACAKMVLNDWMRGKLPYFVPPPGCQLEPRPDDDEGEPLEFEEDIDIEEPEMEAMDEVNDVEDQLDETTEQDDKEANSDNDTCDTEETMDSSVNNTDSLYENVKFADYDKEEAEKLVPSKPRRVVKVPENLQEYVKQDFRKIVSSVQYYDEEKYEGGTRKKSIKPPTEDAGETTAKEAKVAKTRDQPTENSDEASDDNSEATPFTKKSAKLVRKKTAKTAKKVAAKEMKSVLTAKQKRIMKKKLGTDKKHQQDADKSIAKSDAKAQQKKRKRESLETDAKPASKKPK
jgi:nuclear GTP-binding protein